jgi:hypothetical protein
MTFLAAFIRGLTGFGMAIILVPLLGMILSPGEAVVLGILLQLLIGPVGLKIILADSDRVSALSIGAIAALATPLGVALLRMTPPDIARVGIALVAIGAFAAVLIPKSSNIGSPRFAVVATGLSSGLLTGFAAMPGPPVVPYYMRQPLEPRQIRASMMLVFFITAIAGTLSSFALGLASWKLAALSVILFLPMLLGNQLGGRAFGRISPPVWRSIVAVILAIAGISAISRLIN